MKIGCILPVRGEPLKAMAGIEIARELATGNHDIQYIIACDDDDYKTIGTLQLLSSATTIYIAPKPLGYGDLWNRPIAEFLGAPMDIYIPLSSDIFIAAPNWDALIVSALSKAPPQGHGLIAWNDPSVPGTANVIVYSKGWVDLTGRLFPTHFPFWFIDTWVDETYSFVSGNTIPIIKELTLTGKRGKTRRLRDLEFWWQYFTALRPQREADAAAIRAKLQIKLDPEHLLKVRKFWEDRDARNRPILRQTEATQAYDNEPSEMYKLAKNNAEKHLASLQTAFAN